MKPADTLRELAPATRVLKRATYEAFEFDVVANGVRIRNASYANPAAHEYIVSLAGGIPATCSCPADANFDGPCKHRVAVAIRGPVLAAAQQRVARPVVADGGEKTVAGTDADEQSTNPSDGAREHSASDEPTDCACADLDGFPCWPCVNAGRRELPE
ncbi:SWIM zinc finger family protein [Halobaculum limi]|uniref:SWIM zinc finger family protein n=1 Tax=Halobaculum limi TaxID=3031916 RepID=UPI002406C88C|nr:SWIM zinc finger family protein [Halobaculum sp. YSMS11]